MSIRRPEGRQVTPWQVGLLLLAVLAVAYPLVSSHTGSPLSMFVLPALVVATLGGARATLAIGVVSLGVALVEGVFDDDLDAGDVAIRLAVIAVVVVAGAASAAVRERRTAELARAVDRGRALDARVAHLIKVLRAGGLGSWSWDRATGAVRWDEGCERLFGLPPGGFDGRFETWASLVHPADRDRVLGALDTAVGTPGVFRFDHRCSWPDGSVHWLEGMGEVTLGPDGTVTGAVGVTLDVDLRHQAQEERDRLLAVERASRERSEYLARVNQALVRTLDLDEIVERISAAAVPELADWCSLVLTIDRPADDPLIEVAHADPALLVWAKGLQERYPFDPAAPSGAAAVVRTGVTEFRPDIDDALIDSLVDDPELREIVHTLDLRSAITVPLTGSLGTLGALQLVRTSASPRYTALDVSMAEDLADTISGALQNGVLHRRQRRARQALDTLVAVTGRLSSAATVDDVARSVVQQGGAGMRADGGFLYLVGDDGQLHLAASMGYGAALLDSWRSIVLDDRSPVADAVRTRETVVVADRVDLRDRYPDLDTDLIDDHAGVALPIQLRGRVLGALYFSYRHAHRFSDEELSMLVTLAGRCGGALERARLYEHQRDTSLFLQRRLLPALLPLPAWLRAGARYHPATGGEVGGDWYQMIELADGRCAAALGDAVGRGVAAAAAMGQLRAVLAGAARSNPEPPAVLAAIDAFAEHGIDTQSASLVYMLIDPDDAVVHHLSAGHPPAIRIPATGAPHLVTDGRRPLVGIGRPFAATVGEVPFEPGDTLVLYTDGLVERRDEPIDDVIARLLDAADRHRALDPDALCAALLDEMFDDAPVDDDVALLAVRRTALR